MQSDAGTSNTDQIYSLYQQSVTSQLLNKPAAPSQPIKKLPVTVSSSATSIKKIEEIEPEPEIERVSPKIAAKNQSAPIRTSEKVEDL